MFLAFHMATCVFPCMRFRTIQGFPPGVVNVLNGFGPSVGDVLANHPKVDKISFTGSTVTGRKIAEAALAQFKRVTLELGGKSALIVCDDADLDRAAEVAFNGLFPNSGENRKDKEENSISIDKTEGRRAAW